MGLCSKECGRIILWMVWVTVWLVTSIYVALAVITFGKLWQAASEFNFGPDDLVKNKIWRAPLCSLALSAALVFGFNLMSCITLIKKSINRGGPGFGYGFMMAFSFSLSFFLLLCGLVLDGFRDVVKTSLEPKMLNGTMIGGVKSWSKYSSEGFIGALVLVLVSFVVYLLFAFVLVLLQSTISDHLGIDPGMDGREADYATMAHAEPAIMTTGMDTKDAPAAPPDYDSYAQYEQYAGGYGQADGQQQQGYYQNQAGYQAPSSVAPGGTAGAFYEGNTATPYAPAEGEGAYAGYAMPAAGAGGYSMPPAVHNTGQPSTTWNSNQQI